MPHIVVTGEIGDQEQREDGEKWPMSLVRGDETIFADTASDIIGFIIPGYGDIPHTPEGHDDALIQRWRCAVQTAVDVQAMMILDRMSQGLFNPNAETEDVVNVLLADKMLPVEGIDTWEHPEIPLVLVATDYAPYTERPPITGNIVMIDPSDEVAFLHSMQNSGVIEFYTHDAA